MNQKAIAEFTDSINGLIPIDSLDKISDLIRIVSKQIKRETFQFNIDQLETDLLDVTQESLRQSLENFFRKIKLNYTLKKVIKSTKTTKPVNQTKENTKKNRRKSNASTPAKRSQTMIGVPEKIVENAIKKTTKNQEIKTKTSSKATKSGPPKRAKWNKERIIIGIYQPGISHSETEDDPIHRK